MEKRKVTTIPATINKFTAKPMDSKKKRRVAGYARVSTDHEDQQTSYEAQVDYYTTYIQGREDWEFAGLYSDEGISATNTKHRDGFNRMIADALAGKIDLIITKSVSRFARNTVDSLSTTLEHSSNLALLSSLKRSISQQPRIWSKYQIRGIFLLFYAISCSFTRFRNTATCGLSLICRLNLI